MARSTLTWVRAAAVAALAQQVVSQTCCRSSPHFHGDTD